MRNQLRLLATLSICILLTGRVVMGQDAKPQSTVATPPRPTTLHFDCSKEKDPFASYCNDINNFLDKAAEHRKADGKIDRTDADHSLRAAMGPFLDMSALVGMSADSTVFTSLRANEIALQDAYTKLSSGVYEGRQDQQTTASNKASGTTSLVTKGGAPALLAFALESGALTQSVSGNTGTFSANAEGLFRAVTGQQILCFSCPGALGTPILRSLNFSATFVLDQHSSSPVATSGTANSSTPPQVTSVLIPSSTGRLSSFAARYELRNRFDPRDSKFRTSWDNAVTSAKPQINEKATALQKTLEDLLVESPAKNDTDFAKLIQTYREIFLTDADDNDLDALRQHFLKLYKTTVAAISKDDPQFNEKATAVNLALAQYKALWEQILDDARGKPILTLEYTFNHPMSQPETHDIRCIVGYAPKSALGLISVNAGISLYGGSFPTGARYGRLHDGQISAQYDRPISIHGDQNHATFTLAGYWQYQPDPSVLNITSGNLVPGTSIDLPGDAQVLLGTAGSLWVTQAKFTINGKSGIKVPFAVKWSNKTELLTGTKIGAQVGISYDFSSLSSLFGGGS